MCGICGIVNFNGRPVVEAGLKKMNELLCHRGPDEEGYYINGKCSVGLGMRRLSVIDLATGSQPIYNENKTIAVVLNGEIYNFQELRKDLEERHKFYTKTDTEVIVHLYEDYGVGCLEYLRGMFAFALWDEKRKRLFISGDRLGKKPLYYTRINGNFYFASEMKSFLAVSEFRKEINLEAVHYYLTYQYIPAPMTIWKNVFRLEPANFLVLNSGGNLKKERYWEIDLREKTNLTFEDAKKRLKALLTEATKIRLNSDVPLGAFLSGGIDSSIVVGLMSEISQKPVKTFTIGFEESEYSELKFARVVAKHFGTEHHELIVKPDFLGILPKIVWHYDQPYADSSALPSFYVAEMARKNVKVALTGDGGDENFAGYLRYKAMKISSFIAPFFMPVPKAFVDWVLGKKRFLHAPDSKRFYRYIHRFIQPLKQSPGRRNLIWHAAFTTQMKNYIYSDEMRKKFTDVDAYDYLESKFRGSNAKNNIDRTLYADLTGYLPEDLLVKMDVATMAHSLEARSPLLDHKFVEFAATLPPEWKLKGLKSKYILKETFKDFLPRGILTRRKQGFGIPLGKWFAGAWLGYLKEVLLSEKASKRGYFKMKNISRLINDHAEGKADYGYCLWTLLMLELWHRVFIDGETGSMVK